MPADSKLPEPGLEPRRVPGTLRVRARQVRADRCDRTGPYTGPHRRPAAPILRDRERDRRHRPRHHPRRAHRPHPTVRDRRTGCGHRLRSQTTPVHRCRPRSTQADDRRLRARRLRQSAPPAVRSITSTNGSATVAPPISATVPSSATVRTGPNIAWGSPKNATPTEPSSNTGPTAHRSSRSADDYAPTRLAPATTSTAVRDPVDRTMPWPQLAARTIHPDRPWTIIHARLVA